MKQFITLGTRQWEVERLPSWPSGDGGWHSAQSALLICPRCARTWASLALEGDECLWPIAAVCERCQPPNDHWLLAAPPGSILHVVGYHAFDEALLQALPGDLLERECRLHLAWHKASRSAT